MSDTVTVPECPKCRGPMVWCFAIRGCEYVCPECKHGEPMFNGLPKQEMSRANYDALVDRVRPKLEALYEETGEGTKVAR